MSKSTLYDFIATVPICVQNAPIAVVVDIFSQEQCDRLVIVSEQQYPIGVLSLRHLMPQLMSAAGQGASLDKKQPLWAQAQALVEPIATVPAILSVEQFGVYLCSQNTQANINSEWALVDSNGKFLGLLDSPRLLQVLLSPAVTATTKPECVGNDEPYYRYNVAPEVIDSLVQLLERLPWPLMLQTSTGEVVIQNPAWCQHFGGLSDPEAVRGEVETILKTSTPQAESKIPATQLQSQKREYAINSLLKLDLAKEPLSVLSEVNSAIPVDKPEADSVAGSSRCQLSAQPGTCICVLPMQNGQERIWQFVRIPLQESRVEESIYTDNSYVEFSSTPQYSHSNSNLWLLWANDVTEQQQLASELVAKNADLIQLNRLKDEFLACISHELRTPLTAVLGLSTLLKDQTLGQLNERQARYARLIHENGRHLMTVVNDILDLTRMETGQMDLTLEPVKITTVCDRAIKQAKAIQPKTSATATQDQTETTCDPQFTLSIEPGLDIIVVDELRLRQMLFHLLSNAFKFTEAGGEIGLQVSYWEGWIAFTVWDTGIGIPEPKQHLIFQKFQQLENPLTRQFEGTGLGLVLTRALARLHGGDVSFISKEGKGSQFTVLLPPHPPHKRSGEAEESQKSKVKKNQHQTRANAVETNSVQQSKFTHHSPLSTPQNRRNRLVLVVEAAPRFIEDLTEQLTSLGYLVVIARSGTEALEKARRLQPGAIFLNPLLPLLSGWDVLTLLKSDATTSQIPAIVTSTRVEKDKAFSNRADEFLNLPVQPQDLHQVLAQLFPKPTTSQASRSVSQSASNNLITILRLSNSQSSITEFDKLFGYSDVSVKPAPTPPDSSLWNYRVLEADELEQAELLARIWRPDVALLDGLIPEPLAYLQQLSQHSALAALPLVTLDGATTQAANQVTGLSVFPCLTPTQDLAIDSLLSVLQIAARINWEHSVLVVDVATLLDLPEENSDEREKNLALNSSVSTALGSEWFQALIQYFHTAGLRGLMAHSWAEVLQQIRQQSVDLLLLCLGESQLHLSVITALRALSQQDNLPPVLVLDQRLTQGEVREHHFRKQEAASTSYSYIGESIKHICYQTKDVVKPFTTTEETTTDTASDADESLESVLAAIATQILPHSLSMEELLDHIHQTLMYPSKTSG